MKPSPGRNAMKSDEEWRKQLTPEQFHVARQHGTERPFSSPLNSEKRPGMFNCVCCGASLFSSSTKFDSGTGWPSFWAPADAGAVSENEDRSWLMRCVAPHAMPISAMSFRTVPSRRGCATA